MLNRVLILIFLFLAISISFSQTGDRNNSSYLKEYLAADKIYHEAEKLSLQPDYNARTEELEEKLNSEALEKFRNILPPIERSGDDSLAFHCYYKIGVLEHYFDNIQIAQKSYLKAISLKEKLPSLPDSFLFKPYLYTGSIYYTLNFFDSALNNYKKADQIASAYKNPLSESQRLYNTLGVLYYETGNYIQAKNYFEKALSVLTPSVPFYRDLSVNYRNNLASVLIRLEEYDQADSIYKSLLSYNITKDEILHNIGSINLNLGAFAKALSYFRQVNYNDYKKVRLLNDIGLAFAGLKEKDSAEFYFRNALKENYKWNGGRKNIPHGLTFKYLGDLAADQKNQQEAARFYQRAIIQFSRHFEDSSIFSNPENYSGTFSFINLFNTLVAKGATAETIYNTSGELKFLNTSLDAYRSAFTLADYVEQTYDSDEARMFLNKIKYTTHNDPIRISLDLFSITQDKKYLEDAYQFDQQNKASILSLNVKENEIKNRSDLLVELFKEEAAIKSTITRLSLRAAQLTDSLQLEQVNAAIRDNEIALSKLREKMNDDPEFTQKKSIERIPSVNEIREKLDNTSAVLSYHLSPDEILILLISREKFDYARVSINDTFYSKIDTLKSVLYNVKAEQRYTGNTIANWLHDKLITPVIKKLTHIDHLIIIPDDELHYMPFETLRNENREYLIENFSIQYQFSTSLLLNVGYPAKAVGVLAFAPFSAHGFQSENISFDKLPASQNEVSDLNGKIFTDSTATKSNFFLTANRYDIIHLATHANINNEKPLESYIAFYPLTNQNNDYLLYAREIYNMNLDSAGLIILSACETGSGKLVKGEGLMSLSRAFAYAGCSNIIASLWKAEDMTTSFLTQRLHYYLDNGLRKDKALQSAKLDLLNNNNIDPRYKSPSYWSHLVFIGEYQAAKSSKNWWWFAASIILFGSLAYVVAGIKRKRRRKLV